MLSKPRSCWDYLQHTETSPSWHSLKPDIPITCVRQKLAWGELKGQGLRQSGSRERALTSLRLRDREERLGQLVLSSNSDSVWNDENGLQMDHGEATCYKCHWVR